MDLKLHFQTTVSLEIHNVLFTEVTRDCYWRCGGLKLPYTDADAF